MHSISERQGAPRATLLLDAIPKALLIVVASLLASCNGTPTPPAVVVVDAGFSTLTLTVTDFPPTIVISDGGNPGLVGKKEVRLIVVARQDITLISVLLTHWLAGHNNGSRTIEQTINQDMSADTSRLITNEILETEDLAICEGRYYKWTVAYRRANGPDGLFFGQAKLILPTMRFLPNGTLEQGLCVAPPGPDV